MFALFKALLFCTFLVLLCSDVEQNPGLGIQYPCSICCWPVRWNQKALLCDLCQQWAHCGCCSVDNYTYATFQMMACFSWCCPRCLAGTMPFHDCSVLTSEVTSTDSDCSLLSSPVLQSGGVANDDSFLSIPPIITYSFLRMAHLNCRSLLSNLDEVLLFIQSYNVDVMTLSETWLDETVTDLEVCPDGYNLFILERIEIDEEVVLLLFYPITFDVDSALIFLKVMLSHSGYSCIQILNEQYFFVVCIDHLLTITFMIIFWLSVRKVY